MENTENQNKGHEGCPGCSCSEVMKVMQEMKEVQESLETEVEKEVEEAEQEVEQEEQVDEEEEERQLQIEAEAEVAEVIPEEPKTPEEKKRKAAQIKKVKDTLKVERAASRKDEIARKKEVRKVEAELNRVTERIKKLQVREQETADAGKYHESMRIKNQLNILESLQQAQKLGLARLRDGKRTRSRGRRKSASRHLKRSKEIGEKAQEKKFSTKKSENGKNDEYNPHGGIEHFEEQLEKNEEKIASLSELLESKKRDRDYVSCLKFQKEIDEVKGLIEDQKKRIRGHEKFRARGRELRQTIAEFDEEEGQ